MLYAREQVEATVKKVFWYIIIGVGIGALIHNWIPTHIILAILGENNPFSVILATVVGIPMYADIFGTLPIAEALYAKGVGIGTVLSFMMAVTALSLPSIVMFKKGWLKPRLLGVFVGVVALGIVFIGYAFKCITIFIHLGGIIMANIKVLGSGCSKCNELEKNTVEALTELGMDTAIEHVTDFCSNCSVLVLCPHRFSCGK